MRAVRLHKYGERPAVEQVPDPEVTGPLDVIVRIGGAGLCRTDLHLVEGQWADAGVDTPLPYTLGHENAGWVHEIGAGVTHVAPGDTVILHPQATCGLCRACRAGQDMHCENSFFPGLTVDGGMAEFLKTGARAVVKIDPKLQPADVAALADAGLTAYHAVKKAAPLLYPGTRAVVIGAGGLGHIGIQSLKALTPAEIIVVDRSEPALELARSMGADHVVQATGDQVEQVKDLTDGQGAEVVIDFVGERGAEADAWQMTRRAGSHFVIGAGGLGHIGIQSLKALTPAEIIVVDRSEPALELARSTGADHVVQATGDQVEQVKELTDGQGAEVVIDFVGERGAEADAWQMTRRAGSHFVIGYGGTVQVPTIEIISTERNVIGNLVGTYNDLAELMTLAAQGKVKLHTRTYPLDAVNDSMDDLDGGRLQGRGILVP
jgi:NAD+-dependent secondary alcohol dehydrogenase Adh1